jgi:hypothetical protein
MSRGLPLRSRLLTGCVCALTAAVAAGCTTAPPAPTVSGKTLTVYVSAPSNLSSDPQAQDVINAELMAFHTGCTLQSSCAPVHIGSFTVRLVLVTKGEISDHARTAIEDKTSVAYLGEVAGKSRDSFGITNAQDLLQVSPAEAASVPTNYFESYSTYQRTFASMALGSDQAAQTILGTAGGKAFARDFRSTYGQAPSHQAVLGYVAMATVLKALTRAGSAANDHGKVRSEFFGLKGQSISVGATGLGTYTVKQDGTVTITPGSA